MDIYLAIIPKLFIQEHFYWHLKFKGFRLLTADGFIFEIKPFLKEYEMVTEYVARKYKKR